MYCVPYMALEDTHPRLKGRLERIQDENIDLERLNLTVTSLGITDGLVEQIKAFISANPATRLIVIQRGIALRWNLTRQNSVETKSAMFSNGKIIIDEAEFENIKTLAQKQVVSVINDKKQKAEIKELRQENQALRQTNIQQHQELSEYKSVRNKLCTNKDVMRVAELEKFQEAVYRFLDKLGLRKQFDDFLKLFNKQRNEMDR